MMDLGLFFPIPQGTLLTSFRAKFRGGGVPTFTRTAAFQNGLQYRHSDSKIFSGNIVATYCSNLMKISLVIPKITRVETITFLMTRQNRHIPPNISENTGPIFTKFSKMLQLCPPPYGDTKRCCNPSVHVCLYPLSRSPILSRSLCARRRFKRIRKGTARYATVYSRTNAISGLTYRFAA